MKATPTKRSFREMHQRCNNPNSDKWKWYGGRGIKVCERWTEFQNFLADMGERPDGMTLDRKNVDGDYTPENCRWATAMEQGANKRNNRVLFVAGESLHMAEAARRFGIKQATIWRRLKAGWTDEQAVSPLIPTGQVGPKRSNIPHNRKLDDSQRAEVRASAAPTRELCAKYGVSAGVIQTLRKRTDSANNRNQDRATR